MVSGRVTEYAGAGGMVMVMVRRSELMLTWGAPKRGLITLLKP